jgi:hypothetical protein
MDNAKNVVSAKEEGCDQTQAEDQTQFSFSIDNSLEEIYITPSLGKDEKNEPESETKTKDDAQIDAEEFKTLFLLS